MANKSRKKGVERKRANEQHIQELKDYNINIFITTVEYNFNIL